MKEILGVISVGLIVLGFILILNYSIFQKGFESGQKDAFIMSQIGTVKVVDNLVLIYTDLNGKSKVYNLSEEDKKLLIKKEEK
jgi:hypothetical protein